MIYLKLFLSFIQIGLFSFGGGYATIPLMQEQITNIHNWISAEEFANMITISQMTPGPIAINLATFAGTKVGGILGAVVATLGCILPSCIIATLIAKVYTKYKNIDILQKILSTLRPAVIAMIAAAGLSIISTAFNQSTHFIITILVFSVSFILIRKLKMNSILVIIIAGGIKLISSVI